MNLSQNGGITDRAVDALCKRQCSSLSTSQTPPWGRTLCPACRASSYTSSPSTASAYLQTWQPSWGAAAAPAEFGAGHVIAGGERYRDSKCACMMVRV